jgi:hypothetical protein
VLLEGVVVGLAARVDAELFGDRDGELQEVTLTATRINKPPTSDRKVGGDTTTGILTR